MIDKSVVVLTLLMLLVSHQTAASSKMSHAEFVRCVGYEQATQNDEAHMAEIGAEIEGMDRLYDQADRWANRAITKEDFNKYARRANVLAANMRKELGKYERLYTKVGKRRARYNAECTGVALPQGDATLHYCEWGEGQGYPLCNFLMKERAQIAKQQAAQRAEKRQEQKRISTVEKEFARRAEENHKARLKAEAEQAAEVNKKGVAKNPPPNHTSLTMGELRRLLLKVELMCDGERAAKTNACRAWHTSGDIANFLSGLQSSWEEAANKESWATTITDHPAALYMTNVARQVATTVVEERLAAH